MLKHYLKIAFRNLVKYKSHSVINLLGLSIGICASLLILLYILSQYSYDNFHEEGEKIYRISIVSERNGKVEDDSPVFTPPIGPAMKDEIPEVEQYYRMSTPRVKYIIYENKAHWIGAVSYADSTLFELFSFNVSAGNKKNLLNEPYSIVLTEETAIRIFDDQNPLGKMIEIDNKPYYVKGVLENVPYNSHIQFDALISFETLYHEPNMYLDWNGGNQYLTYLKLISPDAAVKVEEKIPKFMWKHINEKLSAINVEYKPYLQKLDKIHLYYNPYSTSLLSNIYIYAGVAILILVIAGVNFVNLTLARSFNRKKEIGVRKVIGANRGNLVGQFLGESLLLSVLGLIGGLVLAKIFYPIYMKLLNADFEFLDLFNPLHIIIIIGIALAIGLVAGIYPSIYLASSKVINNLKKTGSNSKINLRSRNPLVLLQFTIALFLIISTVFIQSQINYVQNRDVGFEKENVVVIPLQSSEARKNADLIKNELLKLPGVNKVALSSEVPYNGFEMNGYFPEGYQSPLMINVVSIDEDFIDLYGLDITRGNNFSLTSASDDTTFIINEALAKHLDWNNPLDKNIVRNGDHAVSGVVKDFNYASMHSRVEPLIITNKPGRGGFSDISVRLNNTDLSKTVNLIKDVIKGILPTSIFNYYFLEDAIGSLYDHEKRFKNLFLYFSILAIILAILGLFSLTSLSIEQRIKEIGIRKVLGASVISIIKLFTKEVLVILLLASLLASPVSYYFIKEWLSSFAFKISISLWVFIGSSCVIIFLSFSAILYQTLKAALSNPVNSLKYE